VDCAGRGNRPPLQQTLQLAAAILLQPMPIVAGQDVLSDSGIDVEAKEKEEEEKEREAALLSPDCGKQSTSCRRDLGFGTRSDTGRLGRVLQVLLEAARSSLPV